jgi:hypothetical protein
LICRESRPGCGNSFFLRAKYFATPRAAEVVLKLSENVADDVFDASVDFTWGDRGEDALDLAANYERAITERHWCGSRSIETQRHPNRRSNALRIALSAWMSAPLRD